MRNELFSKLELAPVHCLNHLPVCRLYIRWCALIEEFSVIPGNLTLICGEEFLPEMFSRSFHTFRILLHLLSILLPEKPLIFPALFVTTRVRMYSNNGKRPLLLQRMQRRSKEPLLLNSLEMDNRVGQYDRTFM